MSKVKRTRKTIPMINAEPSMVRAVTVVLAVLASYGVGWAVDVDQGTVTVIAFAAGIILPLLQGLWTRYAVTANAKVLAQVTTDGRVIAGDAAVEPTGVNVKQKLPPQLQRTSPSHQVIASVAVKPELLAAPPQ